MKLVGRVPVEPLDDERMTHIERRLVAGAADAAVPARAPRRYVGFAMAAMAAVITGVIGWGLGRGSEPAQVAGEAAPIKVNTLAERATLDIGDAMIQSDPATVFVVTRPAGGVLVAMTRGKVELEVGKRGDRAPLVVRAGDTDVIVVGTHFTVDYGDGTGQVDVRVTEGVVRVVRPQHEVRVAAGEAWQSKRGLLAMADVGGMTGPSAATRGSDTTKVASRTDGTNAANGTNGTDGTIAATDGTIRSSDGIAIDTGNAPEVLRNRTAQVPDLRIPGSQRTGSGTGAGNGSSTSGTSATTGSGSTGPTASTIDAKDPASYLKKLVEGQPLEPAMEVGELNPGSAIAVYSNIILEKDGEDESRAFYSMAVLQASKKMGRTADALRTLERYFQRYSRGKRYPEYRAAMWLKLRIVCMRSIDGDCRQAAAKYAREYPDTPAAAVAERITLTD